MPEKTNGKVFWQTKDGDKRLMISWMARKGETKIPIPPQETKIIPIMMKMDVAEADVEFILQSGTPRNIEFVNKDASDEAKQKVSQQAKIQEQNAEKVEQSFEVRKEELKTVEKPIDTNYSKDFHNPYNFVPAIPRDKVTGELADREPSGHSRYLSEMLSGKLRIKMTVKTPLLLPDTARMIYDKQKDHRSFPVRVGADGKKPFINPTAVKGMLRSAYEAVTNSRLSSFSKSHSEKLYYRGGKNISYKKLQYKFSPKDLIETELQPAKFITQLSPADRVFGWVRQGKQKDDELTAEEKNCQKKSAAIGDKFVSAKSRMKERM